MNLRTEREENFAVGIVVEREEIILPEGFYGHQAGQKVSSSRGGVKKKSRKSPTLHLWRLEKRLVGKNYLTKKGWRKIVE